MVKLVQQSVNGLKTLWKVGSKLLRASSSQSKTLAPSPSSSAPNGTLYHRVIYSPRSSKASVAPILNQWVREVKPITHEDLQVIVKQLRAHRRFSDAIQIYEWINNSEHFDISPGDVAVQLDLISKVHGVNAAEKYFNSIPDNLRTYRAYGALLNCYADAKSVKKAEETLKKLRELAYAGTVAYNVMLTLYSKMGNLEKLNSLVVEMDDKGIVGDTITYNIRLNAYASVPDIKEMEKLLMKTEADPLLIDWGAYTIAAKGYLKAGDIEKALVTLKKCEYLIKGKRASLANDILLTLYSQMGKKDDMYRVWDKYKRRGKFNNSTYHCMMSGLDKLGDLDGAEKVYAEWEANRVHFDINIPNLLVTAYCKKGQFEKAISIIEKLVESGKQPNGSTWNRLALGYCVHNEMEKAVETLKKAILASKPGWKPHFRSLASCVKYLQSEEETEREEELKELLRERGLFSKEVEMGLEKYIETGKCRSEALDETDLQEACKQ